MKKVFFKYSFTWSLILLVSVNIHAQEGKSLKAYIILNTECPISQNAVQIVNDLKIKYPHIKFVSVFTAWDKKHEIDLFRKKYNLVTEIIHDKKHKLIMQLAALKTPEVFLLNPNKKIIYEGAISNQYVALGARKKGKISSYLEDAIKDYLLTGFVRTSKTIAVGCRIEDLKKL